MALIVPRIATVPAVARPRDLVLTFVLGGLASFGPLSMDMYLPGLPELARDFGTSASAAQLTVTACLAGLALGQLVAGPLSDRFGRRRPLLLGVFLYAVASLLCAVAPSIPVLVALRFLQGAAGASGIVLARAIVRDLYEGEPAARLFASLMLVNGMAPILAPIIGAQLLRFTTWEGVFVVLAAIGALLLCASALTLGESLPPERRHAGGIRVMTRTAVEVAHDRAFLGYALCIGLAMGGMFAYIAGSPFVLQDIHGLSEQEFSIVFAANGLGIVAFTVVARRLIGRVPLRTIVRAGVLVSLAGATVVLVAVLADLGVAPLLLGLFLVVSCIGLLSATTTTLALAGHGAVAGTASALLGAFQFLLGAAAAPLVGVAGNDTALPMALVIAAMSLGAAAAYRATAPRRAVTAEG